MATVERFVKPATTAIADSRLYQQQQLNHRLETEIAQRTAELRMVQTRLVEYERLAAIGEFVATIVHEIRNPLTTVQMGLDYFTKLDLPQPAQTRLELAIAEMHHLGNLLQEILSYSKPQVLQLSQIEIDAFIQDLLITLRSLPAAQGRLIKYTAYHSPVQILADPGKLKQVFINLVRNACEAVEPGETIHCSVTINAANQVCIAIQNGGAPIPVEILPQLTQPFYSTKAEGTGLGLAIVKRIVETHGGVLFIESSEKTGTVCTVQLPLESVPAQLEEFLDRPEKLRLFSYTE